MKNIHGLGNPIPEEDFTEACREMHDITLTIAEFGNKWFMDSVIDNEGKRWDYHCTDPDFPAEKRVVLYCEMLIDAMQDLCREYGNYIDPDRELMEGYKQFCLDYECCDDCPMTKVLEDSDDCSFEEFKKILGR